jgi:hypothetical protein
MPNRTEEFTVDGKDLLKKVKTLIAESNVRRIIIKNKQAKTIIEIPLAVGVVGTLLAPMLAAVGAVAALVSECSITVDRDME